MKTIKNIIRESVRKMSIPGTKQTKGKHATHHGAKRPETIISAGQRALQRGKMLVGKDMKEINRHSMEVDDNHSINSQGSDNFRTRSQTLGDLKSIDSIETQRQNSSGSQSTIGSGSQTGSAKLLHSSNNPTNFNSTSTVVHKDGLGSPVWKPRHSPGKPPLHHPMSPSREEKKLESTVFTGQAYGDYSNIMYDERQGANILMAPPNALYFEYEDTEC